MRFLGFGVAQIVETNLGCALAVGVNHEADPAAAEVGRLLDAFQQFAIDPKTELPFTLFNLQVVRLIPCANVWRERPLPGLVPENRVLQPLEDGVAAIAADEKPDGILLVSTQAQSVPPTLLTADFLGFSRQFAGFAGIDRLGGEIRFVSGVLIKLDDVLVVVNPRSGLLVVFLPPAF